MSAGNVTYRQQSHSGGKPSACLQPALINTGASSGSGEPSAVWTRSSSSGVGQGQDRTGQFNDVFWQQLLRKLFPLTVIAVLLRLHWRSHFHVYPVCHPFAFCCCCGFLVKPISSLMGHMMWLSQICASTTEVALHRVGNKHRLGKGNWDTLNQQ